MNEYASGFTREELVRLTGQVMFEIRNSLVSSVGYGELAQTALDSSHPAFVHVVAALQASERALNAVRYCDHELWSRGQSAEK